MIIQTADRLLESNLSGEESQFSFKATAKAFRILSSNLYKNKILAVIRELSCNALDAHIAANKVDKPFDIHLPTYLNQYFYVEDFGIGMSPESIKTLYITFFDSTKQNSNEFVGALGLGSKSPFAYTSSFTITSTWQNKLYNFICFMNQEGLPTITEVVDKDNDGNEIEKEFVDAPNGIKVEFPVKSSDIYYFQTNAETFFSGWDYTLPNFVGEEVSISKKTKIIDNGDWYVYENSNYGDSCVALQGPVCYPIDINSLNVDLSPEAQYVLKNKFAIKFEIGTLDIAPSREELSYDAITIQNIVTKAEQIYKQLFTRFIKDAFDESLILIKCMSKFAITTNRVSRALNRGVSFTELLTDFIGKDIIYNGVAYKLIDFINQRIEIKVEGFLDFDFKDVTKVNHKDKINSCSNTVVTYHGEINNRTFSWFDKTSTSPENITKQNTLLKFVKEEINNEDKVEELDESFSNESFDYKTNLSTKLTVFLGNFIDIESTKPLIIVNDLKSTGSLYLKSYVINTKNAVLYVDHNKKSKIEDIIDEVTKFKEEHLIGFDVVKLSSLKDFRAPKKPVTKSKNGLKIKISKSSWGNQLDYSVNIPSVIINKADTHINFKEDFGLYVFIDKYHMYYDENFYNKVTEHQLSMMMHLGIIDECTPIFGVKKAQTKRINHEQFESLESKVKNFIDSVDKESLTNIHKLLQLKNNNLISWIHSRRSEKLDTIKRLTLFSESNKESQFSKSLTSYFNSMNGQIDKDAYINYSFINGLNFTKPACMLENYDGLSDYPMIQMIKIDYYAPNEKTVDTIIEYVNLVDKQKETV